MTRESMMMQSARALVFVALLFALPTSAFAKPSYQEQIRTAIDDLLIEGHYAYKIIFVSEVVGDVIAVALDPPYREFPNIILFAADHKSGTVKRIYEAFCLGIQDKPSGLLDLHTIGAAVDFTTDETTFISLHDTTVRTVMEMFEKERGAIVPYGAFFHGHFGQRTRQRYLIDKTAYKSFALSLLGERYNDYPDRECTMYDTPRLLEVVFARRNGRYRLAATTANDQKWVVTFTGFDPAAGYLVDKAVSAEKIKKDK